MIRNVRRLLILTFLFVISAQADEPADSRSIQAEIEYLRESGRLSVGEVEVASGDLLASFYERRTFTPAWRGIEHMEALIDLVRASAADGLDPEDYHLSDLEHVREMQVSGTELNAMQRAALDIGMTDSLIRLAYHQRFGKVNPYDLDPNWNFQRELRGDDPVVVLQDALDSPSLADFLDELYPREEIYLQLRRALEKYRRIAEAGGWPSVPEGPTIRPGANDERLRAIAERLTVTGDLPSGMTVDTSTYGGMLEAAVTTFQERHGIDADGIVGPATLAAMNVPVERRVDQLRVNLERGRWVLHDLGDEFVVVNIAGFRAYVYRDRAEVWSTRVVVGRPYHQTPVFRSEMKYIVFNPTWTVPYSIATKETLPRVKQDPGYLESRNFEVRDRNGNVIDPANVDWSKLSRGNFPYTFVQRPGTTNALGEIKFIFPNKYSVYLHDTPSKYLFEHSGRTFSHGCVRVENPFDFAEVLLRPDGWDTERVQAERMRRETKSIFLSEPMPVLLLYWTTEVGPQGEIRFYEDVYERDQAILDALGAEFSFRLPTGFD
jgi:murein L,D-transpeptidase YcbB/YkuD